MEHSVQSESKAATGRASSGRKRRKGGQVIGTSHGSCVWHCACRRKQRGWAAPAPAGPPQTQLWAFALRTTSRNFCSGPWGSTW